MKKRVYTIQLQVEAATTTGESEIANSINAALDEPPCDWGDWTVGAARVVDVAIIEDAPADNDADYDDNGNLRAGVDNT